MVICRIRTQQPEKTIAYMQTSGLPRELLCSFCGQENLSAFYFDTFCDDFVNL